MNGIGCVYSEGSGFAATRPSPNDFLITSRLGVCFFGLLLPLPLFSMIARLVNAILRL